MKNLVGKTINYIYYSEDNKYIVFIETPELYYAYQAEADCCCECWLESLSNVDDLIGAQVLEVNEKEFNNDDDNEDVPLSFGYTIKTTKGYCDLEYRTDQSPYYQGSMIPLEKAELFLLEAMTQKYDECNLILYSNHLYREKLIESDALLMNKPIFMFRSEFMRKHPGSAIPLVSYVSKPMKG